jgi:hypothetical protein
MTCHCRSVIGCAPPAKGLSCASAMQQMATPIEPVFRLRVCAA